MPIPFDLHASRREMGVTSVFWRLMICNGCVSIYKRAYIHVRSYHERIDEQQCKCMNSMLGVIL